MENRSKIVRLTGGQLDGALLSVDIHHTIYQAQVGELPAICKYEFEMQNPVEEWSYGRKVAEIWRFKAD